MLHTGTRSGTERGEECDSSPQPLTENYASRCRIGAGACRIAKPAERVQAPPNAAAKAADAKTVKTPRESVGGWR